MRKHHVTVKTHWWRFHDEWDGNSWIYWKQTHLIVKADNRLSWKQMWPAVWMCGHISRTENKQLLKWKCCFWAHMKTLLYCRVAEDVKCTQSQSFWVPLSLWNFYRSQQLQFSLQLTDNIVCSVLGSLAQLFVCLTSSGWSHVGVKSLKSLLDAATDMKLSSTRGQ